MGKFQSIEDVRKFFEGDKLAASLGMTIDEANEGRCVVSCTITEQMHNGAGKLHGGLIFTLADFASAVAANYYGFLSLTINSSVTYYSAISEGKVTAIATVNERTNRLCHLTVSVCKGDQEIAEFKSTFYVTGKEIEQ